MDILVISKIFLKILNNLQISIFKINLDFFISVGN